MDGKHLTTNRWFDFLKLWRTIKEDSASGCAQEVNGGLHILFVQRQNGKRFCRAKKIAL